MDTIRRNLITKLILEGSGEILEAVVVNDSPVIGKLDLLIMLQLKASLGI